MALARKTAMANDVRAPEVPRGEAIIVGRYSEAKPKVALVNPDDLAMLEASHDLLEALRGLEPPPVDELARLTLALEDRPNISGSIEDPERIASILSL